MRKSTLSALALAMLMLAAPGFAQPAPADPPVAAADAVAESPWWSALGDPLLDSLIARGLAANLDIEQAHARILQSRALQASRRAALGPSGGIGAHGRSALASEAEAPGASRDQRRQDTLGVGLDFSWEIDLFGRLRTQADAATQRVQASEAQARGVRLAVSAEIAHAYFDLLGAREQLEIARSSAHNRERTQALVATRARLGQAAPIDDARAQADLEEARAEVPAREAAVRVATHRIAVLLGESPVGFTVPDGPPAEPRGIALRLPEAATWLARRPDLQAHEAELVARALDVKAIRAEFYPRLTITGMLGFVAGSATAIGTGGAFSWLSAPSLLAPLFDRLRIEARLAAAKAGQKEALAAYRQRVLLATEELENAVARYAAGQERFGALQRRARHAGEAERLARLRHAAGASDLLELLEAQRTAQQARSALAQALAAQRQDLVAVFRATAGGA